MRPFNLSLPNHLARRVLGEGTKAIATCNVFDPLNMINPPRGEPALWAYTIKHPFRELIQICRAMNVCRRVLHQISLAYIVCAALLMMMREGVRDGVSPTLPLLQRLHHLVRGTLAI
jgi:hypothetical protein